MINKPSSPKTTKRPKTRRQIAVRYGHLLSYSDEAIARYLSQNTELE